MLRERSHVTWGTTEIPYEIRRSLRRGTVSLAVDPAHGLLVTAPEATSVRRLDAVVRTKARWIVERLRRQSDFPPPVSTKEFVSGETFLYLGRQYRLRLLRGGSIRPITLHAGRLELALPRGLGGLRERVYARAAVIDWYNRLASERLPSWVGPWVKKLGVPVEKVIITEQVKRWGSCSTGVLRINWRIIQAPRTIVEYVLAHEIVHLVHQRHGREFWATLGRIMPDYEARKNRLKELGPRLVW